MSTDQKQEIDRARRQIALLAFIIERLSQGKDAAEILTRERRAEARRHAGEAYRHLLSLHGAFDDARGGRPRRLEHDVPDH